MGSSTRAWLLRDGFGFASEPSGEAMDPGSPVDSVLELNGLVAGGELSLSWRYAPEELDPAVVEGLAASFGRELEALIGHCVAAPAGATAADFPLSGLTQAELAGLELPLGGIEDLYPATPVQQGLLFHSLLMPGTGMYVNQLRLTLSGELDAGALREAWREAASRHAVLRTGFAWRHGGEPLQVVRRSVELPWEEEDWSGEGDYEAALSRWRDADVARGFDLGVAPLLRLALFSRPDGGRDLIWTTHHLLLDGWSAARLLDEVAQSYRAFAAGRTARLPAPARYRDYVAWLSAQPSAETWWRKRLSNRRPVTLLTESLARPQRSSPGVHQLRSTLDGDLYQRLRQTAQRRQVTLSTLAQGAFALLLARYSGRSEVAFGVTVAGRPATLPGVERMIGLFINSLPAWVSVPAAAPVSDWLRSLQAQGTELRQYEHTPLADIQTWAGRPGEPLFDALLVFENYPVDDLLSRTDDGLRIVSIEARDRTNYPLTLVVHPAEALHLRWAWNGETLDQKQIESLSAHYEVLLEQLATDEDQLVGALGVAPMPASHGLAAHDFRSVVERIADQAATRPDATAVIDGDLHLTYAELATRSNRLAQHLRSRGVGRDDRVGLCMDRSSQLVVAVLGILRAGAAYVPLDPSWPSRRLRHAIDDSQVRCIVADESSLQRLPNLPSHCPLIAISELDESAESLELQTIHPEQLAYVIYTSGSTGTPKGVGVSHRNIARLLDATEGEFRFDGRDVWTLFHSYAFDFSVWEMFGALAYGGRLVIVPHATARSPEAFHALIRRERVTVLNQTPSAFAPLMHVDLTQSEKMTSVRVVIFGGEKLEPATLRRWRLERGGEAPTLINMYGITETTVHVTLRPIVEADMIDTTVSAIGDAIPDLSLMLLDEEMNPVPRGSDRRDPCRGHGRRARLYQSTRSDGRTIRARSLRRYARRPTLSIRRSGPASSQRRHRIFGPPRHTGEDPRLSHRTRRDRGCPARVRRHTRGSGPSPRQARRGPRPGCLYGRPTVAIALDEPVTREPCRSVAVTYASQCVRAARSPAPDGKWQT